MNQDKSMPPPARPLSKEQLTSKVKEFPVNCGASIVGITTVETLAGGPPSTDLTYVLENARSAVTFAVPLDEDKTRAYLGKIDREGHQKDYTRASVIADGIAAQLASFIRQFGHDAVAIMQNLVFRNDKPGDLDHRTPDISHKYLAVRGGVGWFGFSGNVLTPDHGRNRRQSFRSLPLGWPHLLAFCEASGRRAFLHRARQTSFPLERVSPQLYTAHQLSELRQDP